MPPEQTQDARETLVVGTFATMLRVELARQQITQDALAARIGSTQAAVSYWTRGIREPSVSKAAQIATVLGVSLDYLCDRINAAEAADGRAAIDLRLTQAVAEPVDERPKGGW